MISSDDWNAPVAAGRRKRDAHQVRLVLWRHGQTDYNVTQRFQGQQDVPLNAVGRVQARQAAVHLATLTPAAIYSSDLRRASATASELARLTSLPVQLDRNLRERHGGGWESLTQAEIWARYPAEAAVWEPPGGEARSVAADRVAAVLRRIAATVPPGSLVVVAGHGAVFKWSIARLLGLPAGAGIFGLMRNCSWCQLTSQDGTWQLLEYNASAQGPPDATLAGTLAARLPIGPPYRDEALWRPADSAAGNGSANPISAPSGMVMRSGEN